MKKRGQSNHSQADQLIALIGAGIIIYILMLPPSDRADLLGQNGTSTFGDAHRDNISILLDLEPITLEYLKNDKLDIEFPSFNLYTRTDAITIDEHDSIYLKRSKRNRETGS